LISPFPSVGKIYAEVISSHGFEVASEAIDASFRRAWKAAHQIPRLGIDEESERNWWRALVKNTFEGLCAIDDFEPVFDDLWRTFAKTRRWKLHDQALETLRELKRHGYRLGIVSNWDSRLPGLLDGFGIAPLIEQIVISSQVGFEKPDPRIFQEIQSRFGLEPGAMLHVGDSEFHDVEPARKLGWHACLIEHAQKKSGSISCLDEIPAWISSASVGR